MAKVIRTGDIARPSAASRMRERREAAGLTQEQAGALRRKEARQVRKWENGESPLDALELYLELEALAAKRAA